MPELATVIIGVSGRVHGVYFRKFVCRVALDLSLTGTVCNLKDGTVEIEAEGEKDKLEQLVARIKVGPPAAVVQGITTIWSNHKGMYRGFVITG